MEQKYIGIAPYDENSDFEFAGRTEETWALYDRIVRNDYTVYYAASGEGKSSLIRAGLIPILRRRNYSPVYIVFKDEELGDIDSIKDVINNRIKDILKDEHDISYEQSEWSKSYFSPEQSEELRDNLWWKIRNYCFKRGDEEMKPLFIFDQFEEIFTKANYEWTNSFFNWLEEISVDYVPTSLREIFRGEIPVKKNFKVLFSFRTEYLGDLDYWCTQKHFIPALQDNRMCLKSLTQDGAREVINLNDALGKYADKIIQGCAESGSVVENKDQPCVYALILSVVCQTLSEMPDKERDSFLESLSSNQDDTIDDILLRFYKKKLNEAGLDYAKDEKIIADLEDAFVDEKGKRSRRDTNEPSLSPLKKWIERLSDKRNGLIKVVGRKYVNGEMVKTVEFPHDRLCRAIDSFRKERQGKIAWKLKRQGEFMQFGIISVIMGIIAFLWNAMMPALRPVIVNLLHESRRGEVLDLFVCNYLSFKKADSELEGYLLDEGFSTLLLMFLLLLFASLMTTFIIRKGRKSQLLSSIISFLSVLSFALLLVKNTPIDFTNGYVQTFTIIGLSASLMCLIYSLTRLRVFKSRKQANNTHENHHSFWPLWGGYFIFASYVFYETLCRVTFGINEPCDSCWALSLLPLLFMAWAWGFFHATIEPKSRKKILIMIVASFLLLMPLSVISYLPYYKSFKQSYGMALSMSLILLWVSVFAYTLWHVHSRSKYYPLTNGKRVAATTLGALVALLAYFLNLGFNPFAIAPKSVCHVTSWRTVIVSSNDSLGHKLLGVVYSADGKTIIPCCIPDSIIEIDASLRNGGYPFVNCRVPIMSKFSQSPFEDSLFVHNHDESLVWDSITRQMTACIPLASTLEQHLHRMISKMDKADESRSLIESIDCYAAKLFSEIRDANIHFALTGEAYNAEALTSLDQLDSLQQIALSDELAVLNDSITFISGGPARPIAEVLEDKYLLDFHRELSRSILLNLIRDRASQSDMPAMFNLAIIYQLAFFTSVPAMNMVFHFDNTINIDTDTTFSKRSQADIYSQDILNKRIYAWYNLFNYLCCADLSWNVEAYTNRIADELKRLLNTPQFSEIRLKKLEEIISLTDHTFAVDNSLQQIIDSVMDTLLPIMMSWEGGIYNNDFEYVCRNLILMSAYRGADFQKYRLRFNDYLREKDKSYQEMVNNLDDIRQKLQEIKPGLEKEIQLKNEMDTLMEKLNKLEKKGGSKDEREALSSELLEKCSEFIGLVL